MNKTRLLRDAERYVLQGKIPQAIAEYLKITKNDPNDVLTLNTIGDLLLREGKVAEAARYFAQVAENYTRNNFLLKAIAVYKKILNAEPNNLETNLTLASLYAKQGLNVDARNQYLRVAELCTREGKTVESLEAYEKVAEMDPSNAAVQLKLAEIHLADGDNERARACFAGAGRAQAKTGDLPGALNSFQRAMRLNPLDVEVMRGFLDASIHAGDVALVLEQLNQSLAMAPENLELHQMLGQACLAARNPEGAERAFQFVLARDDSRYLDFFSVSKVFLEAGDSDRAASCLDPVIPVLIGRRESHRAVEAYNLILASDPMHILTLTKLASLLSAVNDRERHLEVLDKITGYYLSRQSPGEALAYLDKILSITPSSEKHLKLHRECFNEVFPGLTYTPPGPAKEQKAGATQKKEQRKAGALPEESAGAISVEVDLLLNYGMRDRALAMLQSRIAREPADLEARKKLLSIYKEDNNLVRAAEECLVLSVLHHNSDDEETSQKYLAEARKLTPDQIGTDFNLALFAKKHGMVLSPPAGLAPQNSNIELDLSGDLSEIFFQQPGDDAGSEPAIELPEESEMASEDFVQTIPRMPTLESVAERLQEVDFYIRLGFFDEARTNLDEIARVYPNHPELPLRYRQLGGEVSSSAATAAGEASEPAGSASSEKAAPQDGSDLFAGMTFDEPAHSSVKNSPDTAGEVVADALKGNAAASESASPPEPDLAKPSLPGTSESTSVNTMFADLIEEVNALTDQQIAREEFEAHFSLGIAYREMELVEEAIKEFQSAYKALNPAKFPKEAIQCCGMLSTCFLEKEMPRSAIRWCQSGLSVAEISAHESQALRYDMAVAHAIIGDLERALECFDQIFALDPSYRDVAQKIDSLRGGPGRHVP